MISNLQLNLTNNNLEDKKSREESLKLFNQKGFPNKKLEEWKFTDFNRILEDNFKELKPYKQNDTKKAIETIKDFKHNEIFLVNGVLKKSNFKYEDISNIKINDYQKDFIKSSVASNSLINLNDALFEGGFSLEILKNYKFNQPLIIYNNFTDDLKDQIINNKNVIKLNSNSNLELIEINSDTSKFNFIQNNHTHLEIKDKSSLKHFTIQECKSKGFFYKFVQCNLNKESNYEDYIFTSGLRFNKVEEAVDICGENANCSIQSALFLDRSSHQEIKTQINHLKPNCKSYQKIKNVLNVDCKGAYQGKIFVKDIAQKTDAYQLSKALLLDNSSEFNAKPELEIYADDVKCSHGSTSGSINEDSIYYLMTRGLSRKTAVEFLTKAFLFEITSNISNSEIKTFVQKNLDRQINAN